MCFLSVTLVFYFFSDTYMDTKESATDSGILCFCLIMPPPPPFIAHNIKDSYIDDMQCAALFFYMLLVLNLRLHRKFASTVYPMTFTAKCKRIRDRDC